MLLSEANAASPTGPFRMVVEDVFTIEQPGHGRADKAGRGRWLEVASRCGSSGAGTALEHHHVTGVEQFRKVLDSASVGDNVGLLLGGVAGENVMRDDVLES